MTHDYRRPHLIGAAYAILATSLMAALLCGVWVWWSVEAMHRAPQPRPRPVAVGIG